MGMDIRKSTLGYVFYLVSRPIVQSCKNQVVYILNTYIEYNGVVNAGTKEEWIRNILVNLTSIVKDSIIVYFYNQIAIQVVQNPVAYSKMKDVEFMLIIRDQDAIFSFLYCMIDD